MNLYAESSAVLAWLLGEREGRSVRETLSSAEMVFASDLTLIECDRVLIRTQVTGQMTEAQCADCRAAFTLAASHWSILRLGADIVGRARRPFPVEPIRTLDAIHLASALTARSAVGPLFLLSLDDRIRRCGLALGLPPLPHSA